MVSQQEYAGLQMGINAKKRMEKVYHIHDTASPKIKKQALYFELA